MAGGSEFFAVFYFLSGSRITQVIVRTIFGVFWNTPSAVELWFPSLPPFLTSSRGQALILCQGSHSNQTHDLSLLAPCPQHRRNQRPDVKSDYTPGEDQSSYTIMSFHTSAAFWLDTHEFSQQTLQKAVFYVCPKSLQPFPTLRHYGLQPARITEYCTKRNRDESFL